MHQVVAVRQVLVNALLLLAAELVGGAAHLAPVVIDQARLYLLLPLEQVQIPLEVSGQLRHRVVAHHWVG